MFATDMARMAYSDYTAPVRTARSTEADLFQKITRRIKAAAEAQDFPRLAEALHDNRRLWSTLGLLAADDGNALPADLRARIYYLYRFTDQQTSKVLAKTASADVLIDINVAVIRGLTATQPGEPGPDESGPGRSGLGQSGPVR